MRLPKPRSTLAALSAVAGSMLVSACAGSSHAGRPAPDQAASPSVSLLTYRCDSGAIIRATYPTDSVALVRYQDDTHEMHVARSASGVRYLGDGLQWWTKGNGPGAGATLFRAGPQGEAANSEIITRCEQVEGTTR